MASENRSSGNKTVKMLTIHTPYYISEEQIFAIKWNDLRLYDEKIQYNM